MLCQRCFAEEGTKSVQIGPDCRKDRLLLCNSCAGVWRETQGFKIITVDFTGIGGRPMGNRRIPVEVGSRGTFIPIGYILRKPILPGPYLMVRKVQKSICAHGQGISDNWRMSWAQGELYYDYVQASDAFSELIPPSTLRDDGKYYRLESLWGYEAHRRGLAMNGRSPLCNSPVAYWHTAVHREKERLALSLSPIYPSTMDKFLRAMGDAAISKDKWGHTWNRWTHNLIVIPVGTRGLWIINDTDPSRLDLRPSYRALTLTPGQNMFDWLRSDLRRR